MINHDTDEECAPFIDSDGVCTGVRSIAPRYAVRELRRLCVASPRLPDARRRLRRLRRAARVDANHGEIRDLYRSVGAFVLDVHGLPGCLDLLVGFRGRWILVEVKDGTLPPSARRLTPDESATFARAQVQGLPCHIVTSVADALYVIGYEKP